MDEHVTQDNVPPSASVYFRHMYDKEDTLLREKQMIEELKQSNYEEWYMRYGRTEYYYVSDDDIPGEFLQMTSIGIYRALGLIKEYDYSI